MFRRPIEMGVYARNRISHVSCITYRTVPVYNYVSTFCRVLSIILHNNTFIGKDDPCIMLLSRATCFSKIHFKMKSFKIKLLFDRSVFEKAIITH